MSTSNATSQENKMLDTLVPLINDERLLATALAHFLSLSENGFYGSLPRGTLALFTLGDKGIMALFNNKQLASSLAYPRIGATTQQYVAKYADTVFAICLVLRLGKCADAKEKKQFVKYLLSGKAGWDNKAMNKGFRTMVYGALVFSLPEEDRGEIDGIHLGKYVLPSDTHVIFSNTVSQLTDILGIMSSRHH
jgi:hypothetical protein